jgi:hypothetical protein
MAGNLGNLKRVNVREQWPHEASDFTPWLADEENLNLLGEAIGIELEVEAVEVAVGPYSADILARDSSNGDFVVIENQLAKTDHDHLGKSITYAAGLNASAVIWVASEFTDEHRKALDWLNANSTEDISFIGINVELWQINDSPPAVHFNVVSRPAEFGRKVTLAKSTAPLSDTKILQKEWWTDFRKKLIDARVVSRAPQAGARHWYNVALGRSGYHLSNAVNTNTNRIMVRVYMQHTYRAALALELLLEQRGEIENEIGEQLTWDPNPDARDKVITISKNVELDRRDRWPEYLDWMVDMTSKFRNAFSQRLRALDLSDNLDYSGEEDIDDGEDS